MLGRSINQSVIALPENLTALGVADRVGSVRPWQVARTGICTVWYKSPVENVLMSPCAVARTHVQLLDAFKGSCALLGNMQQGKQFKTIVGWKIRLVFS